MRGDRRRDDQDRRVSRAAQPTRSVSNASAKDGDAVVIGMGERGCAVAAAGGALRIALDLCGRRRGAGTDSGARGWSTTFSFCRVGPATRIFGVVSTNAMHSLSPVMHNAAFEAAGHRRGLRAAARRATSTTSSSFADGDGRRGREHHDPVQARRAACGGAEPIALTQTGRRGEHASSDTVTGWEATNTDVDGFLAPLDAVFGTRLRRRSRGGPGRRRCGTRGRRRACVDGAQRHGARAAARAGAGVGAGFDAGPVRGRRRPGRGICW